MGVSLKQGAPPSVQNVIKACKQADRRNMEQMTIKRTAAVTFMAIALCTFPQQAFASNGSTSRLCGETRFETAYEASKKMSSTSGTIIVASGENFPDALAASALAGIENAPILLTSKDELSGDIERWINRNQTRKAFIVGGEAAISSKVESTLKSKGIET